MTHIPRALPWASRCCPFRAFFPDVPLPTCNPGVFPDVPLPTCNPGVFPDVPLPWVFGVRGKCALQGQQQSAQGSALDTRI